MLARTAVAILGFCGVAGALFGLPGCGQVQRPDGGKGLLAEGAVAPDVLAEDAHGKPTTLSSMHGHPVVVYFYPKDGTPGCTKEACAFRDSWKKLNDAQVEVIGVSTGSAAAHREFRSAHHLPFPLTADESGAVGAAFGVTKHLWGYDRVSFLIDKNGKVAKVWPDVDPAIHADDVLRAATSLPNVSSGRD